MKTFNLKCLCLLLPAMATSFNSIAQSPPTEPVTVNTAIGPLTLPPPYHTKSLTKVSKIEGWGENEAPKAADGLKVTRFAENLIHPRWAYVHSNGDVFVAESNTQNSANRISLLRDTDNDGYPDAHYVYLDSLNQPFGTLILNDFFYVANTDGLYRYPYQVGDTVQNQAGEKILDLPAGGYNHHWTRNIITNAESSKIYVSVGSASNVGEYGLEEEERRAAILEINPDGSGERIYAYGLRNPVGMDWNPATGELWAAVNERDKLGDELVPDYVTSVQEGGFYGWPFSYFGDIVDPRWEDEPHMELVKKAIVPDVPLGSHTASLGLVFYEGGKLPAKYRDGAFIGQHGSWNRSNFSGYKVVFIPFINGKPQEPQDFLTGFINSRETNEVYGRPVGVHQAYDGALLVIDDDGGIIWRISQE